jgi:hypothetical protein
MAYFIGTAGDDDFTGTAATDSFDLTQGGDDMARGGNYWDYFYLGGALTAADRINGGAGYDTLTLDGDYSGGLVLGTYTVTNMERWDLGGHSMQIGNSTQSKSVRSSRTPAHGQPHRICGNLRQLPGKHRGG